jgi:F-type H+-transporting ATPase subunit alpha
MMALLKQWVFSPIPVAKQVCALYVWTKGYLDKIPVEKVSKFEEELYAKLDEEKTILEDINKNKVLSEESAKKLEKIAEELVEMNKWN